MRTVLPVLAGMLVLPSAQGQTLPFLSVPTFSLQYLYSTTYLGDPLEAAISVESSNAQTTVLRLDSTAERLATVMSDVPVAQVVTDYSRIRFAAAEGYRITKIEFSGMLSGELVPAGIPAGAVAMSQPAPRNQIFVSSAYYEPDSLLDAESYWTMESDAEGALEVGVNVGNPMELPVFDWSLGLLAAAYGAVSTYYYPGGSWPPVPYFAAASGYLHLTDPRLTIHTEPWTPLPVPEPGQWAMLACGMALLGALGWRRRAAVAARAV